MGSRGHQRSGSQADLKKAVETVKRKDSIQYVVTEELVEAYIVVISYLRWTEKCVSPRE